METQRDTLYNKTLVAERGELAQPLGYIELKFIRFSSCLWSGRSGGHGEAEVSVEGAEGGPQPEETGHAGVF